jgi:hypothetical protein
MARTNRIDDAIKLLEKGIEKIPPDKGLPSLAVPNEHRFKAYINLYAGKMNEAKELIALYAPASFDPTRPLNEVELLRLWSVTHKSASSAKLPVSCFRRNWKIVS